MTAQTVQRGEGLPPVYRQISELLREEIRSNYAKGELLPSEAVLANRFQVNRHTLRRAVDELIADGVVVRHHGVGVEVLEPALDYAITRNTRFTQTLESMGISSISRVLHKETEIATGEICERLQIASGEPVLHLETLREVKGRPFCVISHYLPSDLIEEVYKNYQSGSLHKFLRDRCQLEVLRQESHISAVTPKNNDARLLNMPRFVPILRVKSVNTNATDHRPIEFCISRFRGDAVQLSVKPDSED